MILKPYAKYMDTGIPWSPCAPEHWNVLRAKYMYKKEKRAVRDEDNIVTCFRDGTVTLRLNRRTTGFTEAVNESGYQGVRKGDLVIHVMDAFAGSIGVSDSDGKCTPVYSCCTALGNYNNYYYAYLLREMARTGFIQSLYRGIRERSSDFRFDVFAQQSLVIPPRSEQDQIVRFLDWKSSECLKFVHEKKKEIALLNEFKNANIVKAVTAGIETGYDLKESQISFVPMIPEHWDELMLFQVASEQKISNKTVHHQNLLSLSYGKIKRKDINTKGGLLPASFDTYQIVNNGNVILRLTDLQNDHKSLRVGLATETGIITSAYTCLKPRDNILPEYLYLMLHAYDVSKVFYGMGGGVRQSIGYADIRRMTIPLPPMDEQQAIVDYCYAEQEKIEKLIDSLNDEIAYIQELRIRTISDLVTGKVDVRNVEIPEYETDTSDIDDDVSEDEDSEKVETVDEEVDE